MKFSQKYVAHVLGYHGTSMISRYEQGRSFPPLPVALRLEILYRVPVAFLYHPLYEELRNQIRTAEQREVSGFRQQILF